jgi:hypothetical protein
LALQFSAEKLFFRTLLERAGGLLMHQTEQCKHIIEN